MAPPPGASLTAIERGPPAALKPVCNAAGEQADASALADYADSPPGRAIPCNRRCVDKRLGQARPLFLAFPLPSDRSLDTRRATGVADLPVRQSHEQYEGISPTEKQLWAVVVDHPRH